MNIFPCVVRFQYISHTRRQSASVLHIWLEITTTFPVSAAGNQLNQTDSHTSIVETLSCCDSNLLWHHSSGCWAQKRYFVYFIEGIVKWVMCQMLMM